MSRLYPNYELTGYPNGIDTSTIPMLGLKLTLTSAQLKAIQTTPVLIIPGPNFANNAVVLKRATLQYKFGTTAYTIANGDNAFRFEYVGKTTSLLSFLATGLVDQTANTVVSSAALAAGNIAQANMANLGIELKLAIGTTPALTLGDGTVKITVEYTLIDLS
jgi:hypothetical protein